MVFWKWDFSPIDKSNGGTEVPLPNNIEKFLEWPSGPSYSFVLIAIVIMIVLSIIANYFWSKRKGRRYSEE